MIRLGRRFEFRPGMHRPRPVFWGVIVVVLFAFAMAYMVTDGGILPIPKGGTVVKAEFETAANVTLSNTQVRVKGVPVGTVEEVERQPDGRGVIVTMRIDDGHDFELMRDARADIYWRTLLGYQFYIQLEPGSASEPLGDETIPQSRTTAQVELDQVLASLDAPSRETVRTLVHEFDEGFGDPADPGRAIEELAPAMHEVARGLAALHGTETGDMSNAVASSSRLMGAVASTEVELGELIANADAALAVTAARRADLGAILRDAPATLADTEATMVRLRTTLELLDPTVEELRPGARVLDDAAVALDPALVELEAALMEARPLLSRLEPALNSLASASPAGVSLLTGLEPTLTRLDDQLIPWLDETDAVTGLRNYQSIGPTFAAVSSSAQQFDIFGHVQRFQAVAGGARSAAFLPCHLDFPAAGVDCSDLQMMIDALLGAPAPATSTSSAEEGE